MPDWKSIFATTLDTPLKRVLTSPLVPIDKGAKVFVSSDTQLQHLADKLQRGGMAADLYDKDWKLIWVSEELQIMLGEQDPKKIGIGNHILENLAQPMWKDLIGEKGFCQILKSFHFYNLKQIESINTKNWTEKERKILQSRKKEDFSKEKVLYENTPIDLLQADLPPVRVWCHSFTLLNGYHSNIYSPGLRASVLSLVSRGNPQMFETMMELFEPKPHQTAVIFLDLEGSTRLGKIMPSEAYFVLLSNVARVIDDALLQHGGIVGKHVGDGAVGFCIDDKDADAAARGALSAALAAQKEVARINSDLKKQLEEPIDIKLNGALHFSQNLYMGQMVTGGRLEVTALGEEVNDCARMLEASSGGNLLLSKPFCEKIQGKFSQENIMLDPSTLVYKTLDQFDLSQKARTDTGYLPVHVLNVD